MSQTKRKGKSYKTNTNLEIASEKCATCPFRDGSSTEFLRKDLTQSALNEASRICHSTGSNNAFHRRTGRPPAYCRGARDIQLAFFAAMGVITEPTDAAWAEARKRLGC